MPSRIDDKTLVPLSSVFMMLSMILGATITGAFWVKGVNDRLTHIESKLGIANQDNGFIEDADASEDN